MSGATAWTGIAGYGKRGKSNFQIEGISVNMPLVIEVIEELSKIETILPEIKKVIGDN
jgi:PII-like signaling protein